MSKSEAAIEKLRSLGFTDDKLNKVIPSLLDDLEDRVALDLASVSTDEEVQAFEVKIAGAKTPDEVKTVLMEMSQKAYGQDYENIFDSMFAEQLEGVASMTSNVRDTYHKYMNGDPATVDAVNKAKDSPEVKKITDDMNAAGFDFVKAATE